MKLLPLALLCLCPLSSSALDYTALTREFRELKADPAIIKLLTADPKTSYRLEALENHMRETLEAASMNLDLANRVRRQRAAAAAMDVLTNGRAGNIPVESLESPETLETRAGQQVQSARGDLVELISAYRGLKAAAVAKSTKPRKKHN